MNNFTHLHVHTQYSILDGAAEIGTLLKKTKEYGMAALAITDHGNMYGVLQFFQEAKKQQVKPIIGCELYVAEGTRFEKKGKEDRSGYHLILLAKNLAGYRNLSKLCTLGFKEGFYYTPRIDKELLRKYHEGLIALSACVGGEIPETILVKGEEAGEEVLKEYKEIFGDDLYLEMQRHGLEKQNTVNKSLVKLAAKYNIKLIATNDVHFVNACDAEAHDILVCLNTSKDFNDPNRMRYTGKEFLKTPDEMAELFHDIPESITNTAEIVEKIESYDITTKNVVLPVFPLPDDFTSPDDYLAHLSFQGAKRFYPEITEEVKIRLDFELSVVKKMGFAGYFLIVQDFINEARKMGVAVGPGRGSAAGSIVAFCVGITSIDPIKYNLLFERFLNPERISMPDIDVDFDDDGRDKVIEYVVKKYGKDKVAQIVTFGTMAAKSAIRDVARVLNLPLPEADKLAKLVPLGPDITLKRAYSEVRELADARNNGSPLVKKVLALAEILEGSARHTGTHACGVIIGPDDLIEHIPLCTPKDSPWMATQYEGKIVENVGMLKMDFLGLKTLSIISDAVQNVRLRHNIDIDIQEIPLDDPKTFELYQRGDTIGTFQFESDGMRGHLRDLKPTNIEDLITMNALYRPGPMDNIPGFIRRKHGKEKIEYPHPIIEDILRNTYGIMVYQEQIMEISKKMAGFSGGKADELRKAMGKKIRSKIEDLKTEFVEGAGKKGIATKIATDVYDTMAKFGEYGFNRSHSAAYSVLAYQTGYLKAHYPAEYMAAVLSRNVADIKKITFFMEECRRMNFSVLVPDINESSVNFTVNTKGDIRFGMSAIKGVGENAVINIIEERKAKGHYKSIFDFIERVNIQSVNKRVIEALAMGGAFDSFQEIKRHQYFCASGKDGTFIETLMKYGHKKQIDSKSNQNTLFGGSAGIAVSKPEIPVCEEWSILEKLNKEKETIGIYLSSHPLDVYKLEIENYSTHTLADLENIPALVGKEICVAGIVSTVKTAITKKGDEMGRFTIEDYSGVYLHTLFPSDFVEFKKYLTPGYSLMLKGKVQERQYNSKDNKEIEFKLKSIQLLSEVREKIRNVCLKIPVLLLDDELITGINNLTEQNKGKSELKFLIYDTDNVYVKMFSRAKRVFLSDTMIDYINKRPEIELKIDN